MVASLLWNSLSRKDKYQKIADNGQDRQCISCGGFGALLPLQLAKITKPLSVASGMYVCRVVVAVLVVLVHVLLTSMIILMVEEVSFVCCAVAIRSLLLVHVIGVRPP